jgi:hypothetical protein
MMNHSALTQSVVCTTQIAPRWGCLIDAPHRLTHAGSLPSIEGGDTDER